MSEIKQATDERLEWYRGAFRAFEKQLNGHGGPDRIAGARKKAIESFCESGFPSRKSEAWKYTDVSPIARGSYAPASPPEVPQAEIDPFLLRGLEGPRLVFLNGCFSESHSRIGDLPDGVRLMSVARALEAGDEILGEHLAAQADYEHDAFTALSTAFLLDGAFLHVPDGVEVPAPIQLVFATAPGAEGVLSNPRNLIVLGRGARGSVIETFGATGAGHYLSNAVTEIVLAEKAELLHCKVGRENDEAYHVGTTQVRQSGDSRFRNFNVTLSGAIVRNNVYTFLDDEKIETYLDGVYYARGEQIVDNYTSVDHAKPHCNSFEVYKGIVDGSATGIFNGRIHVHQDAQKTDAKQSNHGLILSEDATINSKPQLEIFADDVKCTHGATVGFLDKEAMFYLQSRGFSREAARDTLVYAFANEVLERIPIAPLREQLEETLMRRLEEGRAARASGDGIQG